MHIISIKIEGTKKITLFMHSRIKETLHRLHDTTVRVLYYDNPIQTVAVSHHKSHIMIIQKMQYRLAI